MNRIKGLDSIRFLCALAVLFGHFGIPFSDLLPDENAHGAAKIMRGLIGCLFNGPAAVIVFFIISGFCIHYPVRESHQLDLGSYYSRRLLRIGIPAIVAVGLWKLVGLKVEPPEYGVLWSVLCEIVYYLLFPLLLVARRHIGWRTLILVAYGGSFALALSHLDELQAGNGSYVALGGATWLLGLPCWLLGCWLAENYSRFRVLPVYQMWTVRGAIFLTAVLLRIAKFHVHSVWAGNGFTLNVFALLAVLWLGLEIAYYQSRVPSKTLEWAGKWSYSLYIIHTAIPAIISFFGLKALYGMDQKLVWLLASLLVSYGFYCLIEYPAHQLAVRVSKSIKNVPAPKPSEVLP